MGITQSNDKRYEGEYKLVFRELRNIGYINRYDMVIGGEKFKIIPQILLLLALKNNDIPFATYIMQSKMRHNILIKPIQEYLIILSDMGVINPSTDEWMHTNLPFDGIVLYDMAGVREMILGSYDSEYFEINLLNYITEFLE